MILAMGELAFIMLFELLANIRPKVAWSRDHSSKLAPSIERALLNR